jgi:hypothetical protein
MTLLCTKANHYSEALQPGWCVMILVFIDDVELKQMGRG